MYKRILLKLSGEALLGNRQYGIDPKAAQSVAKEVIEVGREGVQIAIVIGGGNIFRGRAAEENGLDRATGDYVGMLATMMNGLVLQEAIENLGVATRLMSAIETRQVCEPYIRRRAIRHMEKDRVVILAAGTGHPFYSTDSAAALRALELHCEAILKATKVDGVYDVDPKDRQIQNSKPARRPPASEAGQGGFKIQKYQEMTYQEVLEGQLKIIDAPAIGLLRDHQIPTIVFNLFEKGNIMKVVKGERVGTIIR